MIKIYTVNAESRRLSPGGESRHLCTSARAPRLWCNPLLPPCANAQRSTTASLERLLVRAYPTYIPSLHTISHSLFLREPNITLLSPSSFFIVALSKETYFFSAVKSTYFLFGTHTIRRTHLINKHLLSTSIYLVPDRHSAGFRESEINQDQNQPLTIF